LGTSASQVSTRAISSGVIEKRLFTACSRRAIALTFG
jgi:hypothetical protein